MSPGSGMPSRLVLHVSPTATGGGAVSVPVVTISPAWTGAACACPASVSAR